MQAVADIPVTRINHRWAGLRTFSADGNFVSGFDPRIDGFYWLAGQGGYGVQSCPAMSEITTFISYSFLRAIKFAISGVSCRDS